MLNNSFLNLSQKLKLVFYVNYIKMRHSIVFRCNYGNKIVSNIPNSIPNPIFHMYLSSKFEQQGELSAALFLEKLMFTRE